MADIKIAGIMRAGAYSPNHIGNDAAILNLTAEQLRKRGCEVKIYSEEQLIAGQVTEDVIISMCRHHRSLPILQKKEDEGALVINSGYGIENCTRERLTRILIGSNIPTPDSLIVNTNEVVTERMKEAGMTKAWIKRGDYHTMHKEDVTYVRHTEEAQEVVQEYFLRGIKRAVINRHIEGELLKFYGVYGTPWFHCFFHYGSREARGTDEGKPQFDHDKLKEVCTRAAEALDIKIFGGDAIILPDGTFTIIDFNDWPSFAPCRAEASAVIARAILSEIKNHNAKKQHGNDTEQFLPLPAALHSHIVRCRLLALWPRNRRSCSRADSLASARSDRALRGHCTYHPRTHRRLHRARRLVCWNSRTVLGPRPLACGHGRDRRPVAGHDSALSLCRQT